MVGRLDVFIDCRRAETEPFRSLAELTHHKVVPTKGHFVSELRRFPLGRSEQDEYLEFSGVMHWKMI